MRKNAASKAKREPNVMVIARFVCSPQTPTSYHVELAPGDACKGILTRVRGPGALLATCVLPMESCTNLGGGITREFRKTDDYVIRTTNVYLWRRIAAEHR